MMIRPFQKYAVWVFVLLISFVNSVAAEQQNQEPVKLKAVILPYLSFAPFFIAQDEGYFSEQGLDVEFVKMSEGSDALPLLIQGGLDILTGTVGINVLNSIRRGGTVRIVADKGHIDPAGCPADGILVRRQLLEGQKDIAGHLRGRRISLNPISTDGYYVEQALNSAGLSTKDLETSKLLIPPMRAESLKSGAVDIVHASEPWITRILKDGHAVLWKAAKDAVPNFQYSVVLYGPALLGKNREPGQKFMTAYLKGVREYNKGKTDRNVEIISKHTGLSPDLLRESCWPAIYSDGHINTQSILDFQAWGRKKGWLDKTVSEEQFWEPAFINYANQALSGKP